MTNTLDKLNEAMALLRKQGTKQPNIYINLQGWQKLLTGVSGFAIGKSSMKHATYCGLLVICDNDVPDNEFILTDSEHWQALKQVLETPWIDKDKPLSFYFALAESIVMANENLRSYEGRREFLKAHYEDSINPEFRFDTLTRHWEEGRLDQARREMSDKIRGHFSSKQESPARTLENPQATSPEPSEKGGADGQG